MPCSPGMRGCKSGCAHRALVLQYRAERAAAEGLREGATSGYETELAEYPPIITFKKYIIDHAGQQEEDYEWTWEG